jgi:hypothetical protein
MTSSQHIDNSKIPVTQSSEDLGFLKTIGFLCKNMTFHGDPFLEDLS